MPARVFVGNLNYRVTESQLREFFADLGDVVSVTIPKDRETSRSRGFGFVEFADEDHARLAVSVYDGRVLSGRSVKVSEAEERAAKPGPARPRPVARVERDDDEPEVPDFDYGFAKRRRDRAWRRERAAKRSL